MTTTTHHHTDSIFFLSFLVVIFHIFGTEKIAHGCCSDQQLLQIHGHKQGKIHLQNTGTSFFFNHTRNRCPSHRGKNARAPAHSRSER